MTFKTLGIKLNHLRTTFRVHCVVRAASPYLVSCVPIFRALYLYFQRAYAGVSNPSRAVTEAIRQARWRTASPSPLPNSRPLHPTWPVHRSHVAWMYDSPEAVLRRRRRRAARHLHVFMTLLKRCARTRRWCAVAFHSSFPTFPPVIRTDLCNRPLIGSR